MDAIITAGGNPLPDEPLYEYTLGGQKALLDVAGKPMIQWVLDAVSASPSIDNIIVVGLQELGKIKIAKPVTFLPNQIDMIENVRVGLNEVKRINPQAEFALLVASDIPGITEKMVTEMVENVQKYQVDLLYSVVSRQVMEAKYPTSRRTYTHLKDIDLCGADLNAVRLNIMEKTASVWEKLANARKNPVKQAAILGPNILFSLLFRTATLDDAVRMLCKRLGITGKALSWDSAEVGMDVDKPHQLEIIRADLSRRISV
jgi:GTP:adenosylcobinamide-phosphate guanylyltransferase